MLTATAALRRAAAGAGRHAAVLSDGSATCARRGIHASRAVADYKAPLSEVRFLLNDVVDIQKHYAKLDKTGGANASEEMVDMVLTENAKFCEQVLGPLNEVSDREGCTWVNEYEVKTPKGFKEAYDQFVEGGWQGLSYPEELGGQGLPYSLALFATEMNATSCWTWTMYPGLSKGAINTLLSHGTEELKAKYLPQMVSGEWTGTMCLTEPHCGSDLAQVNTRAEPQADGSYKITGTKIFISCGEHDLTDNIMHCVLARLPDAPEGIKGISLFLVPKRLVDDEGKSGDLNGAKIGRIEDKMGCHGSSTCEINFENATGFLIGTPNRGMNHMFTFINTSRVGTAVQGIAAAELGFQNALWHAKERLAMRSLTGTKNPSGPADPIIVHPDVRKMLLTQKCIAEAGRSMVYECAVLNDLMMEAHANGDAKKAKAVDDEMGFLTPILKGFLTELGQEAANLGIQIYGGHGYIKDNKQEQVVRDVRIAAVWEGTTGIQALDLLGRKIMLQKLKPINSHCAKLYKDAWAMMTGGATTAVKLHAAKLLRLTAQWQFLTYRVAAAAARDRDAIGAASVNYLMYSGYVSMAHHWLKMEQAAAKKLAKSSEGDLPKDFYDGKVKTAAFYFDYMLPRTKAHAAAITAPVSGLMALKESQFSFDHAL